MAREDIGKRLKAFRDELGWSQQKLAEEMSRRLGGEEVTREMVRKYESGHVKLFRHAEKVQAAAEALDRDYVELMEGTVRSEDAGKKMKRIPVLGDLAAGTPDGATGVVEWIDIEDWENPTAQRWGRRIRGDSMEPALRQGDLCIFEDRSAEPGDIVHAYQEKSAIDTIKTYKSRMILAPINADHEDIDAQKWSIRGPLMEVHRKFGSAKIIIKDDHGLPLRPKLLLELAEKI